MSATRSVSATDRRHHTVSYPGGTIRPAQRARASRSGPCTPAAWPCANETRRPSLSLGLCLRAPPSLPLSGSWQARRTPAPHLFYLFKCVQSVDRVKSRTQKRDTFGSHVCGVRCELVVRLEQIRPSFVFALPKFAFTKKLCPLPPDK